MSDYGSGKVSVINTTDNTVAATVTVGTNPYGVAVTPDGSKVYVANAGSNSVSVISTATNAVTATVTVGNNLRFLVRLSCHPRQGLRHRLSPRR